MGYKDPQKAKDHDRKKYLRLKERLAKDPVFAQEHKAKVKKVKAKYHKKHKPRLSEEQRWKRLESNYNVTKIEYYERVAKQNGRCGICDEIFEKLRVDHKHGTKIARGLVCDNCNLGLGHFKDNPDLLRAAALYLESEYWKVA